MAEGLTPPRDCLLFPSRLARLEPPTVAFAGEIMTPASVLCFCHSLWGGHREK